MIALIQRVNNASVAVNGSEKSAISKGLLVFLGIGNDDAKEDSAWLINKIAKLRIFDDGEGVMNNSIMDAQGEFLIISQFTLHARTKKGSRPSYVDAAPPDTAIPLYENFLLELQRQTGLAVKSGEFGADMQVKLSNDGPVTIHIDTKNRK